MQRQSAECREVRSQCDYVMALKENILSNKQRLWRYFFGMFETYDEFARVFDARTQNYECLVLDNTSPSTDFRDNVFWHKAELKLPPLSCAVRCFGKWTSDIGARPDLRVLHLPTETALGSPRSSPCRR